MMKLLSIALFLLLIVLIRGENSTENKEIDAKLARVKTKYGLVEGFVHEIGHEGGVTLNADIFLGIPYAKPPIGELRFEKPEAPDAYLNGSLNALTFGPACASFAPMVGEPRFSEDCLYLNVFTLSDKPADKMSVLVWIHGGGFAAGSAELYGYPAFAANFVSRQMVVVSVQYRLGMFGFFSSGDKNMPGNLGLWDLQAALHWIQDNIHDFGGDATKVTLWGQQSSAAMLGALSLSRHTRDLFSQTIEMSGSVYAGWATSDSVVVTSRKLAKLLNCPTKETKLLKECLKELSVERIAEEAAKFGWRRDDVNFVMMQMRLDEDFFDGKHLDMLIRESPPKPTIQGINSQESMILTMPFDGAPKNSSLIIAPYKMLEFGRADIEKFINQTVVPDGLFGEDAEEVRKQLIWFYVDRNFSTDGRYYLTKYTQILSDMQFAIPTLKEVSEKLKRNWPVYLYLLDYMNPKIQSPVLGTFQTYEFPYYFGFSLVGQFDFNENDKKLQRVMVNSIANFIVTGNPSSQFGGIWPPVTQEHPFGYFDMKPEPVLRDNLMLDRQLFWSNLTQRYNFDLIRDYDKVTMKPKNGV